MEKFLLVFLGGGAGAMARYGLNLALARPAGAWPWATFTANLVGGLLMGVLAGWLAQGEGGQERWRLLLGVGVLGGFTTFSAYSLEIVQMIERRDYAQASVYGIASMVLAAAALFAGLLIARRMFA